MAFSIEQKRKFAKLIRIDITDDQLDKMNIDSITDWFGKLGAIDTNGIEPMLNPSEHELPTRGDVVTDGNIRDIVLANAPDKAGVSRGYFAVPKIMD